MVESSTITPSPRERSRPGTVTIWGMRPQRRLIADQLSQLTRRAWRRGLGYRAVGTAAEHHTGNAGRRALGSTTTRLGAWTPAR